MLFATSGWVGPSTRRRTDPGPLHPRTLNTEHLLGRNLRDQGRLTEAEEFLTRALAGREQVLGPTHPDVTLSLSVLGGLALQQGDLERAEQSFARALGIARPLPSLQVRAARLLVRLGLVAEARGDLTSAEARHVEALDVLGRLSGPPATDRVRALAAVARVRIRTGRQALATAPLGEAATAAEGRADLAALVHAVRALYLDATKDPAGAQRERAAVARATAALERDLRDDLAASVPR